MEGAVAEEVLDVDLVLLHVVQRKSLRVRRGDKYHAKILSNKIINHISYSRDGVAVDGLVMADVIWV